jgi:hypothetical protein
MDKVTGFPDQLSPYSYPIGGSFDSLTLLLIGVAFFEISNTESSIPGICLENRVD